MFTISAATSIARLRATQLVEDAINECHGTILDFHQFSNISLTLTCELATDHVQSLADLIEKAGFKITKLECPESDRTGQILGFVVLTFVHEEPDLKIEVPAVPG